MNVFFAEILADPKLIEEIDTKWQDYLPFLLDYNFTAPEGQKDFISKEIREFYLADSKVNDSREAFLKVSNDLKVQITNNLKFFN